MKEAEIIIIGAGAAGLMAAREISRSGKKVIILEARERTGGRIWSFSEKDFGYHAEAGAEFIHGDLPFTKALANEAKLTLLSFTGETYNAREGASNQEFIPDWHLLMNKLQEVKEDLPIAQFMNKNFPKEKFQEMHDAIKGFVEGYDAADPTRASTLALRDEWSSEFEESQFRIKEGYGAMIQFLEEECRKQKVEIIFHAEVKSIHIDKSKAKAFCSNENTYEASKIMLTVPLPVLKKINFTPPIPKKLKAASEIGYGVVIKFLLHFKTPWWKNIPDKDFNKLNFIFSSEVVPTWWTQYPELYPVLTGWLAGPNAEKFIHSSSEQLLDIGLHSLCGIFKVEKDFLKKELLNSRVINWGNDAFALGAYAYATPESTKAKTELLEPVNDILYFSGEAMYEGKEMGTVEAALASGFKTATAILME